MRDDTHIADGIAVKLLLAGIVVASSAVGALWLAPGTSQAAAGGLGEDPSARLAFPIDDFTASAGSQLLSLDGKGNDPFPTAFSIDDFPPTAAPCDVKDTGRLGDTGIGSVDVNAWGHASVVSLDELSRDMDPY